MARRSDPLQLQADADNELTEGGELGHLIDARKVYFSKSRPNVFRIGDRVFSYKTHVATIYPGALIVKPKYAKFSASTSRHLSIVCHDLGLVMHTEDNEVTKALAELVPSEQRARAIA